LNIGAVAPLTRTTMKPLASFILLGTLTAFTAVSCTGSKSLAKKGAKLDASGLYAEAADMYLQSLVRNTRNVDAKIGLKKTGQQLLNDKLSAFFKAFGVGDSKEEAVNAYLGAKNYADRVGQYGVVLDIPANYTTDFNEVKGRYLMELYERGQALMAEKDYKGAETVFAKITALEPSFKDSGKLQDIAYLEPLYVSGKEALEQNHYRKAYDDLSKVITKDASYKDALALRNEAVEKGRYAIAVLPFAGTNKDQAARVQALSTTSLTEIKDPFIKVVDRENIERILAEQRLGLSGVVDEATAVQAGKLMGAHAVLMGTLIDYREETGTLKRSTKDGFQSYQLKVPDPANPGHMMLVTKYKPTRYTQYQQVNKVYCSFSYKLVSLETGEVLLSKLVDRTASDQADYATYDGDKNTLWPARNGLVDASNNARRDLQGLLSGPHEVKAVSTLSNEALREAIQGMSAEVQQQLASKLP
jgi:tetratricopeptide (TPR) repeat protein